MPKLTPDETEALSRAENGESFSNYPAIFAGFMAKGIAEADIEPRVNVFTYPAWRAKGRQVKSGEHGVKVVTFVHRKDAETGEESRFPTSATVFHVTQTELAGEPSSNGAARDIGLKPRFDAFHGMEARRQSVGCVNGADHKIEAGDWIGWARKARVACCASCWADWSAENAEANRLERSPF